MQSVEKLAVEAEATLSGQMWTCDDLRDSVANHLCSHCQHVIVLLLSVAFGFVARSVFRARAHSLVIFDFDAFAAFSAESRLLCMFTVTQMPFQGIGSGDFSVHV